MRTPPPSSTSSRRCSHDPVLGGVGDTTTPEQPPDGGGREISWGDVGSVPSMPSATTSTTTLCEAGARLRRARRRHQRRVPRPSPPATAGTATSRATAAAGLAPRRRPAPVEHNRGARRRAGPGDAGQRSSGPAGRSPLRRSGARTRRAVGPAHAHASALALVNLTAAGYPVVEHPPRRSRCTSSRLPLSGAVLPRRSTTASVSPQRAFWQHAAHRGDADVPHDRRHGQPGPDHQPRQHRVGWAPPRHNGGDGIHPLAVPEELLRQLQRRGSR